MPSNKINLSNPLLRWYEEEKLRFIFFFNFICGSAGLVYLIMLHYFRQDLSHWSSILSILGVLIGIAFNVYGYRNKIPYIYLTNTTVIAFMVIIPLRWLSVGGGTDSSFYWVFLIISLSSFLLSSRLSFFILFYFVAVYIFIEVNVLHYEDINFKELITISITSLLLLTLLKIMNNIVFSILQEHGIKEKSDLSKAYTVSICHELRNPLAVQSMYIDLAKRDLKEEYLLKIESSTKAMASIVDRFEKIDPNELKLEEYSDQLSMIKLPTE